jgi:hypothetical protein
VHTTVCGLNESGVLFQGLLVERALLGGMGLGQEVFDAGLLATPLPVVTR